MQRTVGYLNRCKRIESVLFSIFTSIACRVCIFHMSKGRARNVLFVLTLVCCLQNATLIWKAWEPQNIDTLHFPNSIAICLLVLSYVFQRSTNHIRQMKAIAITNNIPRPNIRSAIRRIIQGFIDQRYTYEIPFQGRVALEIFPQKRQCRSIGVP